MQFKLSNLLPIAILKTDSFENISCEFYQRARIFKIIVRVSVVRSFFRETTGFPHSLKLWRKPHHVHIVKYRKVVFSYGKEISRNSHLTGVIGLQSTGPTTLLRRNS